MTLEESVSVMVLAKSIHESTKVNLPSA